MFCSACGSQVTPGAAFCSSCGTQVTPPAPPYGPAQHYAPPQYQQPAQPYGWGHPTPVGPGGFPVPVTAGNGYSTAAIILGALAFLFFPIVVGPAGFILGAIGQSKGEDKAAVGMAVSACGTVIGMILGMLLFPI